jgi:transcriptional regulator GlxA family with amidase domain
MPENDAGLPLNDAPPRRIGFLLIPGFALIAYSCAMEPYRAANTLSGRTLYAWKHVSPDGKPVLASNGVAIVPDQGLEKPLDVDDLFVCAGGNPALFRDAATMAWLRGHAARGLRLGGISGGPYILARAGLLAGRRCTAHWEHIPALQEDFPTLQLTGALFEIDRDRCTSSGGIAAMDMMIALIRAAHGRALAAAVSEWFLHSRIREGAETQRMHPRERYGVTHPGLLAVLDAMAASLEEPLPRAALARLGGVSLRQLERLFRSQLGSTVGEHYRDLRLDRARLLLRQGPLGVLETAMACGFVSAAHFSRAYRARFGLPPRAERAVSPTGKSVPPLVNPPRRSGR